MPNITDLRRERAQISTRVQAIASMDNQSAADVAEFDSLKVKFDGLGAQIERLEAAERMAASAAVAVDAAAPVIAQPKVTVPAEPKDAAADKRHNLAVFTGMINALNMAKGNPEVAIQTAKKMPFPEGVRNQIAANFETSVSMAMNTESSGSGGVLVPTVLARNVIGYLFPNSVIQSTNGGPLPIDLPNGNLDIGRISSAPTASYTGRNAAVGVTSVGTDKVSLSSG
jgi:HK97 family phage major capsid protein